VGPKLTKKLLRNFSSVKGINDASVEQIAAITGINLANKIKEYLTKNNG